MFAVLHYEAQVHRTVNSEGHRMRELFPGGDGNNSYTELPSGALWPRPHPHLAPGLLSPQGHTLKISPLLASLLSAMPFSFPFLSLP